MHQRKIAITLAAICFLGNVSLGQSSEEDKIREVIRAFTKDLVELKVLGAAKADKVLGYTTQNFHLEAKVINIMNVVSSESFNMKEVNLVIHQLKRSDVSFKRTLGDLDDVYVRERLAYARYKNEYELYESDRLLNKGTQYVDLIFRKNLDQKWRIDYMRYVDVDDIQYKGMCICEIYENKGLKNIITSTIVPDGSTADVLEDKFSIDDDMDPRAVRHGFRDYLWSNNGQVHKRKLDGTQGDQIGTAKSRQELLLLLLKKEVYPDRCYNVIRKLK